MADVTTYIQALNGEEIIDDICGAIADKLRKDCNLRREDGYAGGYKATVKIHLECFGLDTAVVDQEVILDESTADQNPLPEPDELIDLDIDIPQETDLQAVRTRSGQIEPSMEITSEGPVDAPKPRKYTRRLKALASAQGGATGLIEG